MVLENNFLLNFSFDKRQDEKYAEFQKINNTKKQRKLFSMEGLHLEVDKWAYSFFNGDLITFTVLFIIVDLQT